VFPKHRVKFNTTVSIKSTDHSPKSTAATFQRHSRTPSYTTVAGTVNTSILKTSPRALRSIKASPHQNVQTNDQNDIVWEKEQLNLEHFQDLRQFEKLHDARHYYNAMRPPINQHTFGKQMQTEGRNFEQKSPLKSLWARNDRRFIEADQVVSESSFDEGAGDVTNHALPLKNTQQDL